MMASPDFLTFLKSWLKSPRAIGSVTPSSKYLAQRIADCIHLSKTGSILELGPGTGAITQAICNQNIPHEKIILVEQNANFAKRLKEQFNGINVIQGNAAELTKILANEQHPIDTIISGLPLVSLSKTDREAILAQIPQVLSKDGLFIQFTYDLRKTIELYPDSFQLVDSFLIWRNIPPARVLLFTIKS